MNLVTTISEMFREFFAIKHNSARKISRIALHRFYKLLFI